MTLLFPNITKSDDYEIRESAVHYLGMNAGQIARHKSKASVNEYIAK